MPTATSASKKKGGTKMTSPSLAAPPPMPSAKALPTTTTPHGVFVSRDVDVPALTEAQVTAENATHMLDTLLLLNQDDRLLAAEGLRQKLAAFVADAAEGASTPAKDAVRGRMEASPVREELALLQKRGVECREAADDLAGYENWTLAVRSFGFDTYVRPMGGQMYVKVEGEQEGTSVFDQLVVVRQAAMYHRWGPFVCSSALIHSFKDLGKAGLNGMDVWYGMDGPLGVGGPHSPPFCSFLTDRRSPPPPYPYFALPRHDCFLRAQRPFFPPGLRDARLRLRLLGEGHDPHLWGLHRPGGVPHPRPARRTQRVAVPAHVHHELSLPGAVAGREQGQSDFGSVD